MLSDTNQQNIGEAKILRGIQRLVITDENEGVFQLLEARARATPRSNQSRIQV